MIESMFAVVSIGAMWCEASPAGVDCGCLPPCIVVKYSEEHFGLDPVTGVESSIGIREYEACCHAEGVVISQNGIRSFLSPTSAQTIVLAERTLIRQQVGYTPHFEYVLAVLLADPSAEPLWPPGELPAGQGLSLSYSEPTTGFLHEMDLASREPFRVQEYRLWIHSRPVPTSPGEPVVLPDRRLGRGKMQTSRGSLHVMVRLSTKVRSRDCGATWKEMRAGVRLAYQPTIIRMLGFFRLIWIRSAQMWRVFAPIGM